MAVERTLSILKPDATRRNITGKVNSMIEEAGLRIIAQKRIKLDRKRADDFYAEHHGKPFFEGLVNAMTSGPIVVQVLEGENAIAKYREIAGATNPANAAEGTIRHSFGIGMPENTVHGSDCALSAAREIAFYFTEAEILP